MLYALFITLILSVAALGQANPKKPASKPGKAPAASQKASHLVSDKGRFSINLPESTATFQESNPTTDSPNESGGKYMWDLEQGVVTIDYSDNPDLVIKTKQDYADMAEGLAGGVESFGGKVSWKKAFNVGRHRGYQIAFVDPQKLQGFTRMLVVGDRTYTLFGLARAGSPASRAFIVKALDSFRLTAKK